jgi:hypothetical protein
MWQIMWEKPVLKASEIEGGVIPRTVREDFVIVWEFHRIYSWSNLAEPGIRNATGKIVNPIPHESHCSHRPRYHFRMSSAELLVIIIFSLVFPETGFRSFWILMWLLILPDQVSYRENVLALFHTSLSTLNQIILSPNDRDHPFPMSCSFNMDNIFWTPWALFHSPWRK